MSFFSELFGNSKKLRRIRNSRSNRPSSERKTQLELQLLEDRTVPAVMSAFNGTALTVTLSAANDTAILSENGTGEIFVTDVAAATTTDTTANISQLTGGISLLDSGTNAGQTVTFDNSQGAAIDLSPAALGGLTVSGIETINVNNGYVKLAPGAPSSDIDFHFLGGNGSATTGLLAPTDSGNTTGGTGGPSVLADTNWNNINNSTATQTNVPLHDATGAATSTTVSFSGTNAWASGSPVKVLNGYLDNSSTTAADTVTLNGVPYATYSVYVYFGSDTAGRSGTVALNGGTPFDYKTLGNASTFVQTTDTAGAYPSANYAIFTGVTGSTFTLSSLRTGPAAGNNGVMAVEIVPVVPPALTLSALNVANGATFDTNGNQVSTATLGGGSTATITNSNTSATAQLTASSGTYSGTMTAVGSGGKTLAFATSGTGTIVLNNASPTFGNSLSIGTGETVQLGDGADVLTSLPSGNIVDNGTLAITGAATSNGTLSGAIGGTGAVTISGSVTVGLTGASGYTGPTTIGAGSVVNAGNASALGNSDVTLNGTLNALTSVAAGSLTGSGSAVLSNSSALTIGSKGTSATFTGVISGGNSASSIVKSGAGNETFTNANTFLGNTTITAGTLALGVNNALPTTTGVVVNGGILAVGSFTQNVQGAQMLAGSITGTVGGLLTSMTDYDFRSGTASVVLGGNVGLTKSNTVLATNTTVLLSNANTFTGTVTVSSGILQVGNAKALGSPAIAPTSASTIVLSGGELDLNGQVIDPTEIIQISGTGNTTATAALIDSSNTNSTLTQLIYDNTLNTTVGSNNGAIVLASSTSPTVAGYIHSLHPSTQGPATDGVFTFNKVGSDTFLIAVTDVADMGNINVNAGVLTVTTNAGLGTAINTAATPVTYAVTVQSGATLSVSSSGAMSFLKNVILMGGGTLASNGTGPNTLGDGTGKYSVFLNNISNYNPSIIQANTNMTLASQITGGALQKSGGGILTPTNSANNYTGQIQVFAGTFFANNAAALGNSNSVFVDNGGTLQIDGNYVLSPTIALTIQGSGVNNAGALNVTNANRTISQNIALGASATIGSGTAGDKLVLSGNILLPATASVTFTGAGSIEVVNAFGNGTNAAVVQNSLTTLWYPNTTTNVTDTDANIGTTTAGGAANTGPNVAPGLLTMTPTNITEQVTQIGVNALPTAVLVNVAETNGTAAQIAATTTGMTNGGTNSNRFGAAWVGTITVGGSSPIPAGIVSFGLNSDDGSVIYVDVNNDGIFSPSELVVNDAGGHGPTQKVGAVSLTAGTYPVYIGYYEGSGGGSMEAKVGAGGTVATPVVYASQTIINPSDPAQAGIWASTSLTPSNSLIVTASGTGTVTLDANNTYNGATTVTSGTLVAAGVGSPTGGLGAAGGLGVTVASGATLAFSGGVTVSSKNITLVGTGVTTGGALVNLSGANVYTGTLTGSATTATTILINNVAGTLTLNGAINPLSSAITLAGAGNYVVNSNITTTTPSAANTLTKNGSGNLTLTGTNNYAGLTSVNGGLVDITNASALGATTAGTTLTAGTLQVSGGLNISGEALTITGSGVGGIGAIDAVGGNTSLGAVVMSGSSTIDSGTAGATLTINSIDMAAVSDLTFSGAGNAQVLSQLGNGLTKNVPGFNEAWFPGVTGDAQLGDNAATTAATAPFNNTLSPNTSPGYLTLAPTDTTQLFTALGNFTTAQMVARSEAGPNSAAVATAMNAAGNKFGAAWTGTLVVGGANMPAGPVSFGTNSDDGSAIYVDLNQDGIFEANELIVNSDGGHGTRQRVGTTPSLAAGNYAVYIGYYESSGGGSMEARVAAGTQATYTSQLIIDPSSPAQAGVWAPLVVNANNNIIMNGTGKVELDGNDSYNGTTTVNSGTLEVDGVHTGTGVVSVNASGTLAGVGTLPGSVNVNAGATLSPGTLGGTATGILSVGSLNFAAASPSPVLSITIDGSAPGTEYDQVKVATSGSATLNGAVLNLSFGPNVNGDSSPTQAYTFLDMTGGSNVLGTFAGHAFGSSIPANGNSYALSDTIDFEGNANTGGNDVGLLRQVSNNYFVSATWAGDATNTNVTDPVLTDGQTATFGVNAFASIQDALAAEAAATSSITSIIVNPGAYSDTTVTFGSSTNPAPTIVLQGTAISIASLNDTSAPNASITVPSGTTLTVGGDGNPSLYEGTIVGAGSFVKAGSGNLTLNQNNILSGSVEISGGTLQLGDGSAIGTIGTGAITVDPSGTLTLDEPSSLGTTTLVNVIAGSGTIQVMGFSNFGAVALVGTESSFSGGITINGGRLSIGNATSIGNPATVTVASGGQFSFGTASNANFSGALTISGLGYSDGAISGGANTGALLFTGANNTWSGPITVNTGAELGAIGTAGTISGAISGDSPQFGSNGSSTETFVLTGNNTYTGTATIENNAAVNIGNNNTSGTLSTNASVTLSGSTSFLDYDRTDATTWSQSITGQGGIRIRRGGTLDLDGTAMASSAVVGTVIVGNGTLTLSGGENLITSGVTSVGDNLNSGVTATTGTVTGILNVPTGTTLTANTLDVATTGSLATLGTVNQTGGTVTLAAANSPLNDAGLRLGVSANGTGTYSLSSGTLSIGNNALLAEAIDGAGNFVQTGGTASAFEIDVNAFSISTPVFLSESNPGNDPFNGGNGFATTTTTGTGKFTLSAGIFQLGGGGLTFDGGTESAVIAGGTLQFTANSTISTPVVASTLGAAIIDTQGFTVLDTQPISGAGVLDKLGTGTLNLTAANTYTGGTTVVGNVGAYNNAALGTGTVTLATGGHLVTGALAGLAEGSLVGATNTTSVNPANAPASQGGSVILGFAPGVTAAESSVLLPNSGTNSGPGDPGNLPQYWGNDNTWVYTGYFFDADPTGKVAMAENIDDDVTLIIDGKTVLSDTQWNVATTTSTTANGPTTNGILSLGLGPNGDGWHSIELRVANGGGGAGPSGNVNGANTAGWTTTYGFGFQGIGNAPAVTTVGDINGADYAPVADPGNGSLFRVGYATKLANNIVLAGGTLGASAGTTVTLSGTISGTALTENNSGTIVLTGANTYSGVTSIASGILDSNNASALGTLAIVAVDSGSTLSIGTSQTISILTGSGTVTLNGNVLTVGTADNASSDFAGVIADGASTGGKLVKAGTGSLTLTGTNTFTGTAAVTAGSLIVNGSLSNSSTVSISGTGVLGGTGSVGTVKNVAGIVDPGTDGSPGTLSVSNLTLGPGALVLDLSNAAADSVNVTSAVDITGATLSLNVGTVTAGESFTILSVPGNSGGLTGTFNGLDGTSGHDTITAGGTVFTINYAGGDGNDVTLTATGTAAASIVSTVLNGGIAYVNSPLASNQHSMVENVVYSFSSAISLSAANFTLSGINGTTTAPNVVVSGSGTVWTVTFSGAGVNGATHSIDDGEYRLVMSGVPGLANNTFDFFRLLGDMDGSGTVDTTDFTSFISTFLRSSTDPFYLGADDFDGSGGIDSTDFTQFTNNFLKSLPLPLPN